MSYDLKYHSFLTAIERGDYNEVVRMISSGAFRVNEEILYFFEDRGRYIVTPLHWAVRHNHPRLCQYLLNHGAEPYRHQVQEYFPLHEACDKGFDEVVQKFIDAKCDLNYPTSERDTPLHVACMRGNIACVHALLAAGVDVNAKNVAGHTPLETALYHGHRDLEALFEAHNRSKFALNSNANIRLLYNIRTRAETENRSSVFIYLFIYLFFPGWGCVCGVCRLYTIWRLLSLFYCFCPLIFYQYALITLHTTMTLWGSKTNNVTNQPQRDLLLFQFDE